MDATRKNELVTALSAALQAELKAVKMYHGHAESIADPEIVQGLRTILEVEEGHAHALALRIRALGRQPAPVEPAAAPALAAPTADPGEIADMLRLDLADEQWAITHYAEAIAEFLPDGDDETLGVLEENLIDELRHARWLRDRLRRLV
jgi:bacterioferritin (cytochrome b1)